MAIVTVEKGGGGLGVDIASKVNFRGLAGLQIIRCELCWSGHWADLLGSIINLGVIIGAGGVAAESANPLSNLPLLLS